MFFCIYAVYIGLVGADGRYKLRAFVDKVRGNTIYLKNDGKGRMATEMRPGTMRGTQEFPAVNSAV